MPFLNQFTGCSFIVWVGKIGVSNCPHASNHYKYDFCVSKSNLIYHLLVIYWGVSVLVAKNFLLLSHDHLISLLYQTTIILCSAVSGSPFIILFTYVLYTYTVCVCVSKMEFHLQQHRDKEICRLLQHYITIEQCDINFFFNYNISLHDLLINHNISIFTAKLRSHYRNIKFNSTNHNTATIFKWKK